MIREIMAGNLSTAARLIQAGFTSYPSLAMPYTSTTRTSGRRRARIIKISRRSLSSVQNSSKKANLSAARKERVKLPIYDDGYCISEFLSHPLGIRAVLNTSALQSFESLDSNTYRCVLPKLQLLNFEAAPVLDLRVTPNDEDCTVELLSCKFQGSEIVEGQNEHFSAFMMNRMTWNANDSEPFLEVDVKLNLTLEIYTQPLTLLPTSAVEGPGNLLMQALVDRLVPLLLQQLLQDYGKWIDQQRKEFHELAY